MARPSELEGRLLAILDAARDRSPATAPRLLAGTAASALVVVTVAMLQIRPAGAALVPEAIGEHPRQSARVPAPTPTPVPAPEPMPAPPRLAPVQEPRPPAGGPGQSGPGVPVVAPGGAPDARRGNRAEVPDNVVKALAAALNDENEEVRQAALHTLARLESPLAFEPLVAALRSQDVEMRQIAAFSLGQLGDERAVAVLTSALKDEDGEVRHNAAFALGQLEAQEAVPALIDALKDPTTDVRQVAAFALGQLGDRRALDPLVAALKDGDPEVRQSAAFALSQVIDDDAVRVRVKKTKKTATKP
jgi:vesicle coat complex subunit